MGGGGSPLLIADGQVGRDGVLICGLLEERLSLL